jgi:hypothetical protein
VTVRERLQQLGKAVGHAAHALDVVHPLTARILVALAEIPRSGRRVQITHDLKQQFALLVDVVVDGDDPPGGTARPTVAADRAPVAAVGPRRRLGNVAAGVAAHPVDRGAALEPLLAFDQSEQAAPLVGLVVEPGALFEVDRQRPFLAEAQLDLARHISIRIAEQHTRDALGMHREVYLVTRSVGHILPLEVGHRRGSTVTNVC